MSIVNAFELINKFKKLFYDQLSSYGYKDIFIEMNPSFYSKEVFLKKKETDPLWYGDINLKFENDNFYYVTSCRIYFWDEKFGYELWLSCDLRSKWSLYKSYIPINSNDMNEIIFEWLFILKFLYNRENLRYTHINEWDGTKEITKQLLLYLEENDFKINHINDIVQNINISKSQKSYSVMLRKVITQNVYNHNLDDNEPLEYSDEDIKPFKDLFTKQLEELGVFNSKINLYPDLGRLSVQSHFNGSNRQIDILSYNNILYDTSEVEEIFQDILSYYFCDIKDNSNQMLSELKNNGFHIYSCSDDCSEIFAYKYGEKIEIRIQSEIVFDDMEGHRFESFCAKVLMQNGFENVKVTSGSGDQGVDIIAYKDDINMGFSASVIIVILVIKLCKRCMRARTTIIVM